MNGVVIRRQVVLMGAFREVGSGDGARCARSMSHRLGT